MGAHVVNYEQAGIGYAQIRRADPRIAAAIHAALGDAQTVLNVGAGAGNYEPTDRYVLAVEPSAAMRAQRPAGAAPAIDARAEKLPFDTDSFDAAMACATIHHWQPPEAGLAELRRVTRGPVVIFTFELQRMPEWQRDYFAEPLALEMSVFPALDHVASTLGGKARIERIPIPGDCTDGFVESWWKRPEVMLDPIVRASQSMWKRLPAGVEERAIARLRRDLESGEWDRNYGYLREQDSYNGSLALVISEPD
jgi:SAM-dependent methyltransferase